jgi:hypothetical protein
MPSACIMAQSIPRLRVYPSSNPLSTKAGVNMTYRVNFKGQYWQGAPCHAWGQTAVGGNGERPFGHWVRSHATWSATILYHRRLMSDLLNMLQEERATLVRKLAGVDAAISALTGSAAPTTAKRRRTMSAAARMRISAAQKKRWAKRKK